MTIGGILRACLAIAAVLVAMPAAADPAGKKLLVPFSVSPFPYRGDIPGQGKPFLDVTNNGRRGHTSPRDGILWEDETYSDRRVLLYLPPGFDSRKPAVMVLFFHGNQVLLERDVEKRQGVLRQLAQSHLNAVFVAPQFAVNALDSSAGTFWQPGTLAKFLDEAASRLVGLDDGRTPKEVFAQMPVVMVAYSGGYLPAAYSLSGGGLGQRIAGLVLMDALYGEIDKFADWIAGKPAKAFVFSTFSESSRSQNSQLQDMLRQRGATIESGGLSKLAVGDIVFMSAGKAVHNDFLTQAWTSDPLRAVFSRIARLGYGVDGADLALAAKDDSGDAAPPDDTPAPAGPVAAVDPPLPVPRPDTANPPAVAAPAPLPAKPADGLAPPAGGYVIELATAGSRQEALVKAAHLEVECAEGIKGHKTAVTSSLDGAGFSVRIGPLSYMDYTFLCAKLKEPSCMCRPVEGAATAQ